jgi:hypothetical protein
VTPEFHRAHNLYVIELTGVNSLLSKYQYHILPELLQVIIRKKEFYIKMSFFFLLMIIREWNNHKLKLLILFVIIYN